MWNGKFPIILFTQPLQTIDTHLQKKAKKFKWTEEAKKAFNEIKKPLLKSNTLREGMGGTLLQKQGDEWVVIEYHSKRVRINRIISEHPQFYAIATQQIFQSFSRP